MSIHLDGLNPDIRDDTIEFPADVNGKRIRCSISHAVRQRLNLKTGDHELSSLFKQNPRRNLFKDPEGYKKSRRKRTRDT